MKRLLYSYAFTTTAALILFFIHYGYGPKLIKKFTNTESRKPVTKIDYVTYDNTLTPIQNPDVIFGNGNGFIYPVDADVKRFKSSPVVNDEKSTIHVRAWRYSYNADGIIETDNYLNGNNTALIIVHPWGVEDGQGLTVPQPAGFLFQGGIDKNKLYIEHTKEVLRPFVDKMRGIVALIAYSLSGERDPIRNALYNTNKENNDPSVVAAREKMSQILSSFSYYSENIPRTLELNKANPVFDYFNKFKGDDSSSFYNTENIGSLPIPIVNTLEFKKGDVIFYDDEGYKKVKETLIKNGVRNVILAGYNTDLCLKSTAAGYDNLRNDFNVFIAGDATLATNRIFKTPAEATTAALSRASINNFITETSWISGM